MLKSDKILMGCECSSTKNSIPNALTTDSKETLNITPKVKVLKNEEEDPKAPLLTNSILSLHKAEAEILDKELENLVGQISDDEIDQNDFDELINYEEDIESPKNE